MVAMMTWGIHEQGWRKGPWTPEEDKLLSEYISKHGEGRWSSVASCAGLNRTGKSCRLRWVNYLRPGLKRGHLTPQEEGIIIELHALWGNKWSTIARCLPGRTDNEIKNYWRTHFKMKEKSSQKQEKRKQLLKEKREQQQQRLFQQKLQARENDMQTVQDILHDNPENAKQMEETQEKQDTVFAYPATENQYCAPYMHHQDLSPTWFDTAVDVGLWGGLWNLDEPFGCSYDRINNNKSETPHNQSNALWRTFP